VISLDSTQNNFLYGDSNETAFYSVTGSAASASPVDTNHTQINEVNSPHIEAYDPSDPLNSSYKVTDLTTQSAPDGGETVAMLGAALIGLAALRRKFALPASPTSV
jgi:hypothetical protein